MLQFRCVSLGRPTPQNTLQAIVSLQVLSTQGGAVTGRGREGVGRSGVCGVALLGFGRAHLTADNDKRAAATEAEAATNVAVNSCQRRIEPSEQRNSAVAPATLSLAVAVATEAVAGAGAEAEAEADSLDSAQ